jgi:hypothetical protein
MIGTGLWLLICWRLPSLPDIPIIDYITATESYVQTAELDEVNAALLRKAIVDQIEKMKAKQRYRTFKDESF